MGRTPKDFESNLTRELDFTLEAQNGEETARQLAHCAPHVYVPKVFKELAIMPNMEFGAVNLGFKRLDVEGSGCCCMSGVLLLSRHRDGVLGWPAEGLAGLVSVRLPLKTP